MLSVEVLTLFPRMIAAPLEESILGKAREKGLLRVQVTDIREFADGKHRVTDEAARQRGPGARVVLLSPQGPRFNQGKAQELADHGALILVCGRYEGVDERVLRWVDEELSLGDFVLTGGELAALAVIDAIARLVPGVLGNELSAQSESFSGEGLLEGPQYTRPPEFRGLRVPEVLLSGDHEKIARWRQDQAVARTRERRPDLLTRQKA